MFFFIGLTMATIQGTYARRISPGKEAAAVKRVRNLTFSTLWSGGALNSQLAVPVLTFLFPPGNAAAGTSLPPHWLGSLTAHVGLGTTALLLW